MKNTSSFLQFALHIAREAGRIQMSYFGNISEVEKKSTNIDLLTKADLESEKYIIDHIRKEFPKHSILSEESGKLSTKSKYLWVIDPLDGTTNFAHNLPIFSISIGLVDRDIGTICAVVYNPAADKCFYAEKNKGAFLNEKAIKCTSSKALSDSLLATGFPYEHNREYDMLFDIFKDFYDQTRGLRRLGAASLDLCFVAMGRFDGFYEYGLKFWDICAGVLIVEEAGGVATDWDGVNKIPSDSSRVLAANKYIHSDMSKVLMKKQYKLLIG